MTSAGDSISVRWVSFAEEIDESLWLKCFPPPLEGSWWYRVLDHCGIDDQFSFAYAVLECAGRPIGIAPAFVMDVPMDLVAPPLIAACVKKLGTLVPRLRYQRTLFVGSPCSDEGTVGLLPGWDLSHVAPALQRSLEARAKVAGVRMIVWKDFPSQADALENLCQTHDLFRLISYPGTRLSLGVNSFEEYLKQLSSKQRHNLKKKLQKSHRMGMLDKSVVQSPDDLQLQEIFQLFWQTYARGKTKFERLTPDFFKLIGRESPSNFIMLRNPDTGKLVAFMLCFLSGSRVINKYIGLDYSYGRDWFLYFRLWEAAVEWTIEKDARELQSGQTGYGAKHDIGHCLVPLVNYCRHRNPVLNSVFKRIARRVSWSTLDSGLKELEKNARHSN
jgi:hypothetical protein